jgi:uncharacterized protein involved in exopolysaccharide biosynthesis
VSSDLNSQPQSQAAPTEQTPPQGAYAPAYWCGPPAAYQQHEVQLSDLLGVLISGKWWIISLSVGSAIVALTVSLLMTPIYRAPVLLAPIDQERGSSGLGAIMGRLGGLADLAGVSLPSAGDLETSLATLKSREFITSFIDEQNLKPVLFAQYWDATNDAWIDRGPSLAERVRRRIGLEESKPSNLDLEPGEPSDWKAYEKFKGEVLSVNNDRETGLVTVATEWEDPTLAASWANLLVERLNSRLRRRAITDAERSIAYLRDQVEQTSLADLRAVLFRVIEEHTKNITLAQVSEEYAFTVIDPAVPPEEKVRPKRLLIVVLGFVLGVVVSVLALFLRVTLSGRLAEDVENKSAS